MQMAADLKSVTTGRVRNLTTQMVVPTLLIAVIVGILLAERVTMTAQITATPTVTVASITLLSCGRSRRERCILLRCVSATGNPRRR